MTIKRVGTGNPPPPVPPLFESRKGQGSQPDLGKKEVFEKFKNSAGYPDAKGSKYKIVESVGENE